MSSVAHIKVLTPLCVSYRWITDLLFINTYSVGYFLPGLSNKVVETFFASHAVNSSVSCSIVLRTIENSR